MTTTTDRIESISRRISGEYVSNRVTISPHLQRWGWVDGVPTAEIRQARVRRTREDLALLVGVNNLQVEWTLEGRLGLMKALRARGEDYRQYYKYGSRLRPAKRPQPLP
jgi:hypothetical protein